MVNPLETDLIALSSGTVKVLSDSLNQKRLFQTKNDVPRDWRGLARVFEIGPNTYREIERSSDPTGCLLTYVKDITLVQLIEALERIERWDIIDDTEKLFERDAELYLKTSESAKRSAEPIDNDIDSQILTIDDLLRLRQGQRTQLYDAFVLHAEEDKNFANEIVYHLEDENNMKLCLKDRDLVAGVSFEHEAIMRLISERCNRLIIVLSPEFFKSSANTFFINFAQAAGIDKNQQRKIIPCIYKTCDLPVQLMYLSKIYYDETCPQHFWMKLINSTQVVSDAKLRNSKHVSKCLKEYLNEIPLNLRSSENKLKITAPVEESETKNSPKEVENEDNVSEILPHFPSLQGLESLSSDESSEKKIKKKKQKRSRGNSIVKKLKTLLAKD